MALTDEQGAVIARYVYEDPFGDNPVVSGTASTPIRFAGGYRDPETGFYKFGERYYTPNQGRWTQRDPLSQAFSPREANRYLYVGQDPVNLTDPTGMIFGYGWDDLGYTLVGTHTFLESTVLATASVAGGLACSAGTAGFATAACFGVAAGGVATAAAGYYFSFREFGMIGTNP